MVCPRCLRAVEYLLRELNIPFDQLQLGSVRVLRFLEDSEKDTLSNRLNELGFEVLQDRDLQKVERIKNHLRKVVADDDIPTSFTLTRFLADAIKEDYSSLSYLFSSMEGITIEKYFIHLKIEKVKEWLFYGDRNLSEASYALGYSSVQHLSSQFKKITGMTPSEYKSLRNKPRHHLDTLA